MRLRFAFDSPMISNMPTDYVIGHEPMGVVEEIGPEVKKLKG